MSLPNFCRVPTEGQKKSHPLELELQTIGSSHVLGMGPGTCGRAASAPNHWATSPVPEHCFDLSRHVSATVSRLSRFVFPSRKAPVFFPPWSLLLTCETDPGNKIPAFRNNRRNSLKDRRKILPALINCELCYYLSLRLLESSFFLYRDMFSWATWMRNLEREKNVSVTSESPLPEFSDRTGLLSVLSQAGSPYSRRQITVLCIEEGQHSVLLDRASTSEIFSHAWITGSAGGQDHCL